MNIIRDFLIKRMYQSLKERDFSMPEIVRRLYDNGAEMCEIMFHTGKSKYYIDHVIKYYEDRGKICDPEKLDQFLKGLVSL